MNIKETIRKMTLEEKASLCSGVDFWHTQPIERLGIPAVMVTDGPHGLRKQAESADHLGINESVKAVCFPAACASTASFDRELLGEIGKAIGDSCQHEQVCVNLGPAINIKRSPLCGRNFEYMSEDPYLAGEMAVSIIQGIQSKNVGVSVKHFLANSQEHRRMSSSSNADERTLREIYLPAFENAVKRAHPWTVMCSYNRINGFFASQNKRYLTEVLRDEWGFDGYVMSDWGAVSDRVKALEAGLDLEMPSSGGVNDRLIVEAVREGRLDEKLLDQAVERILTVNQRYLSQAKPETPWDREAQHELARHAAGRSMVLLKNEGNILPLQKHQKVAVIGQFARKPRYQGGGSSHINSFKITSLMDALAGNPHITYADGYDLKKDEPDEALIAEAVRTARQADVAVIMAGLPDAYESEGYDRSHLRMPDSHCLLIERVAAANPNTVVVLHNGAPVEMPWIASVRGVLEAYLGGEAAGAAVADILYGDVNPSGRLPESFPLRLEDTPCFIEFGGEADEANYTEGVFVGYRYYDKKKMQVLFPFGYGLSYTDFAYSDLRLDKQEMLDTDTLMVFVRVENTGKRAGQEVVQLYVADRESTVHRPVRELKGFEKISLAPGESKVVTFALDKRAFAYWNPAISDWHVETGAFGIQICRSSRDVILEADVQVLSTVKNPAHYDENSILMDLLNHPRGQEVLKPLLEQMQAMFGVGEKKEEEEEGIFSGDGASRMILYTPLRSLVSFGGGAVTHEMLAEMLKALNS